MNTRRNAAFLVWVALVLHATLTAEVARSVGAFRPVTRTGARGSLFAPVCSPALFQQDFIRAAKKSRGDNEDETLQSIDGGAAQSPVHDASDISHRVRVRTKGLVGDGGGGANRSRRKRSPKPTEPIKQKEGAKARLARAKASLLAERKAEEESKLDDLPPKRSFAPAYAKRMQGSLYGYNEQGDIDANRDSTFNLQDLSKRIDQKIRANSRYRSGRKRDDTAGGTEVIQHHETDSMHSLLDYNQLEGEWSDRNATTYQIAIVFGKPLLRDRVTIEYATRLQTLAKMLRDEPSFRPSLVCFTGGMSGENSISDASAGYVYFRHLCAVQNIPIDDARTKFWVDTSTGGNERDAMERIASELWRNYIKQWLNERPLTERLNQHYGVGWTILERTVDIHFTLVSTEYHLCNLNDVHHRSPGKSFLQPLVSLRGLVGSDRWVNTDELEAMDPSYSSSVHVRNNDDMQSSSDRATFGGIENSVDTSWSFQYGTYPFLHGEDAVVFLGQCYLLGEELTPLLVNMKGVVEQTEFFQRDNYLLLSSIRRSLVSLVEALYTDKGQEIRAGVIKYFTESQGRNQFTKEDVKIIVVLESALLNLGRCIDLVKPAGLLVSSVPAATWSKALFNLEESMSRIKTVCDPDQPLDAELWGKLD